MKTFFTGLQSEFSKITWPTPVEAIGQAVLVIVLALFVGYYLGLLDAIFAGILRALIG